MNNPWYNSDGGDSDLMYLYKVTNGGSGGNPVQRTQYQQALQQAGLPANANPGSFGSSSSNGGGTQPLSAPDVAALREQVYTALQPYYTQLAKEAQGDFTRATQILQEDYAKGTRDARVTFAQTQRQQTDDLKNTLATLGITNIQDQEAAIDKLNQRGMGVYQNNPDGSSNVLKSSQIASNTDTNVTPGGTFNNTSTVMNPTDANMGRGGYELSQLQQEQRLRQEAQQRAATRPLEQAGIQLKQYTNLPNGIDPNLPASQLGKALAAPGVDRSQLGTAEQGLVRGTETQTRELQKSQEDLANQRSSEINSIAAPMAQTGTKALGSQMENQLLKEKQNTFVTTGT